MESIKSKIQAAVKVLYAVEVEVELSRPDPAFGDFSTNVALKLAKQLQRSPVDIAGAIAERLKTDAKDEVSDVRVAGPGFLNFFLQDKVLINQLSNLTSAPQILAGQTIVTEYSDPNPFKVLHAGHLYTSVVGDAISNLLETAGAHVHRVNFGGDVGRHVAQTMWAILQQLGGENPERLEQVAEAERSEWLAEAYVTGTAAYETDEQAKAAIVELNKKVYALHANQDHESPLAQIYWTTRQWSYDYFDKFYETVGVKFEKYYPESRTASIGLKTVQDQLKKGVFQESDGAVVFKGDEHGLHTRVFINSEGLPTYETKDVGLIFAKWEDYHFDLSVVITGNEQEQYMTVVLKAIEQFAPELAEATRHLTHGLVKLKGGEKMSSRKGNILRAIDVLNVAAEANNKASGKQSSKVVIGAVKYAFLKVRTGGDIIYDAEESVSLEGNSGPYLQYAHARAKSILRKSKKEEKPVSDLKGDERTLVVKLSEYRDVVSKATVELTPHLVCTYLYELAQVFNRFYEHNRVIDDKREEVRLRLVIAYAEVLKDGLNLLGIEAPEEM